VRGYNVFDLQVLIFFIIRLQPLLWGCSLISIALELQLKSLIMFQICDVRHVRCSFGY